MWYFYLFVEIDIDCINFEGINPFLTEIGADHKQIF